MPNRKSKSTPQPFIAPHMLRGRLVRVCPECQEQIVERTDNHGMISNDFAEHWEAEHREQEPERHRYYVLAAVSRDDHDQRGFGPDALRALSDHAIRTVREHLPEVDWALVDRLEDLPEQAPTIQAGHVVQAGFSNDPRSRQIRWYRREGDVLVFSPTPQQIDAWQAASDRARDVRTALIDRHRDDLPKFSGKSVEEWQTWYDDELKPQQDAIAADFDAQRKAASNRFWTGESDWQDGYEAAIAAVGIPEDEVEASPASHAATLAAADKQLRASKRAR